MKNAQEQCDKDERKKESDDVEADEQARTAALQHFMNMEEGILSTRTDISRPAPASSSSHSSKPVPLGYEAVRGPRGGEVYVPKEEALRLLNTSNVSLNAEEKKQKKKILGCFWIPSV